MTPPRDVLAVFGGRPAFDEPLHVGRPNIGDPGRLRERMDGIIARRWLTNDGPMVQEFERKVADHIGVRHCIAVCNGTLALQLVLKALGLEGEVIVPSFTFIATASALAWQGLRPVFCDIDPATHCIDPVAAKALITSATAAILAVHLWGRICDTTTLEHLARERDIPLLIDAAQAFASSLGGRMADSFGTAGILSFHATKIINAFEGGAIVTNDDSLADDLRRLRNFGFTGPDAVAAIGINAKMSEASAAMGLTSLESLADFIACNRTNYQYYQEGLVDLAGLRLLPQPDHEWNHHYIVAEVDANACGLTRDMLLRVLHAEGVLARRYFYPGCHRSGAFASKDGARLDLPVTDDVAGRVLQLPTGTAVGSSDIARIAHILSRAISMATELREQLEKQPHKLYCAEGTGKGESSS